MKFSPLYIIILSLLAACSGSGDVESTEIQLLIPTESQEKLDQFRSAALDRGIISDDLKKYVDCRLVIEGDTVPAEMRLKGDWTDHLESDKVSYRIKLSETDELYDQSVFSIQNPETRNFLHEWFLHKLMEREGLLATTYEIIQVGINSEESKTYAYEGHFTDKFLIRYGRPEGPIMKFDESPLWALRVSETENKLPIFHQSVVTPFNEDDYLNDDAKFDDLKQALILMERFKYNDLDVDELFDMEQSAKYFAILDLGNVEHGRIWHNLRCYYNPESKKLELIGFDLHPGAEHGDPRAIQVFKSKRQELGYFLDYSFFNNEEFRTYYLKYLKEYSSEDYLDEVFDELDSELDAAEALIKKDDQDYKFDRDYYYGSAEHILESIEGIDAKWDEYWKIEEQDRHVHFIALYDSIPDFVLPECSVNAFVQKSDSTFTIRAINYHLSEVLIVGYALKKADKSMYPLAEEITMNCYKEVYPDEVEFKVEFEPAALYFKTHHSDELYKVPVYPWPYFGPYNVELAN